MSKNIKNINDFEGKYLIYSSGKVFSIKSNKFLKNRVDQKGYERVMLYGLEKPLNLQVHRLVAIHFLNNEDKSLVVNHKDGNKINNDVSNLEFVSHRENTSHRSRLKTKKSLFIGVYQEKKTKRWMAQIHHNGKRKYLGLFITQEDAHIAYQKELNSLNLSNKYSSLI